MGVVLALCLVAPAAHAQSLAPTTTSYATIGGDPAAPYSRLKLLPGWKRVIRTDLAEAKRGRSVRRTTLTYFAQLSDFQLADEESPVRVEALDLASTPFTAAWRPQEALGPHTVDQVIRQVNRFTRSPLRTQRRRRVKRGPRRASVHATLDFAVLTGDNADNQQINETQWVVRLLEGGRLDPNSGVDPAPPCAAGPIPEGEGKRYTGVQDDDDVIDSGRFYDPDAPAGSWAAFPRYPGLMDHAQQPFDVAGLRVPSYTSLGNHDGSVQGNVAANAIYNAIATSCVKPLTISGLDTTALLTTPIQAIAVPPDPARAFASRPKYMELHRTGAQSDAHGFGHVDAAETAASAGFATYYAFTPKPGLRFISINTVGEGSNLPGSDGNIDHPQFQWLTKEIKAATARNELIVLFGHHPIRTLVNRDADEDARPCSDPTSGPGCDGDPRTSTPLHLGGDLQQLLIDHPHVIAFVAGHTHEHRVTAFKRQGGGGFWGIETASEVDWPLHSRLLEIFDNRDGTLSIFGTILDHGAAVGTPPSGTPASAFSPETMASIGRELAYNDPQGGAPGGEGKPEDRNVELLVKDPRG